MVNFSGSACFVQRSLFLRCCNGCMDLGHYLVVFGKLVVFVGVFWCGAKWAFRLGCVSARGRAFSMGRMRSAVAQASASMAFGAMVVTWRRLVLLFLVFGLMRCDWRLPFCSKNW